METEGSSRRDWEERKEGKLRPGCKKKIFIFFEKKKRKRKTDLGLSV